MWRSLRRQPAFWFGATVLAVYLAMALFPAVFVAPSPASHDPRDCAIRGEDGTFQDRLAPSSRHWFGTDLQGCDLYARVVHGTRASVTVGVVAVVAAGVIAVVLGGLAGFAGGIVDGTVSRVTDVVMGFPLVVGALLLLSMLTDESRDLWQVALVLGLLGWPLASRLVRSSVRQTRDAPFVEAARLAGSSSTRAAARHVLPNSIAPLLGFSALAVAGAVAAEAGLSFLGVGLQEPAISWGQMINSGQARVDDVPHLLFFPALFLSGLIVALLALASALQTAADPRSR